MLLTNRAFIATKLTVIESKEHRMTNRKKSINDIRRTTAPLANSSSHTAQALSQEPTKGRAKRTLDEEVLCETISELLAVAPPPTRKIVIGIILIPKKDIVVFKKANLSEERVLRFVST